MSAKVVARDTVTTGVLYSARICIRGDTAIQGGARRTVPLHCVRNVIDDIRTFLLNGLISASDIWEIRITKKPSVELGLSVSSLKRKEKKSPLTIDLNVDESSNSDLPAKRELSGL